MIFLRSTANLTCYCVNDVQKHIKFRRHLNEEEKQFFNFDNIDIISINRRIFEQHGLPLNATYMANGDIFYNSTNKTWKCTICGKITGKYEWGKITNRVNSKHNIHSNHNLSTNRKSP